MVETTFLAGLGAVFLVILVVILRSGGGVEVDSNQNNQKKQKKLPKEKKPKEGKVSKKNPSKKVQRTPEPTEWTEVYTSAKDAQEMLEFLKGKDPTEIAKHLNQPKQQQQAASKKKSKKEAKSSEVLAEVVLEEGFELISTKKVKATPPTDIETTDSKKPKEGKKEGKKNPRVKAFFKEEEIRDKDGKKIKEKRVKKDPENNTEEKLERPRKERPPKREHNTEGEERPPKREKIGGESNRPFKQREGGNNNNNNENNNNNNNNNNKKSPVVKRLPIVPPNVKYEEANLDDILNSITADFKPKPKIHRIGSLFSKIPRNIVISILSLLDSPDLLSLSEVNHYFSGVARKEPLWKDLLFRDFGLKDVGKNRGFRAAYRAEYKKRKQQQKKKTTVDVPPLPSSSSSNPSSSMDDNSKDSKKEKEEKEMDDSQE